MVLSAVAIGGCAPTYVRYLSNKGATQQQFVNDRYACLQQTQQRVSGAYVNQYGGASGQPGGAVVQCL